MGFVSVMIVLFICLLPAGIRYLCRHFKPLTLLGPTLLCYAGGILLGAVLRCFDFDSSAASLFVNYTIPVAIPLILFSSNFKMLKHLAKGALLSFCIMCGSVLIVSTAAFFVFRGVIGEAAGLCGMMIGLYTGGTPNLYAIGSALGVGETAIAQSVAVDTAAGGLYFLLLISIVPPIIKKLLPYPLAHGEAEQTEIIGGYTEESGNPPSFKGFLSRVAAVMLAVLCFGLSAVAALLVTGGLDGQWVVVIVMLGVTTLGIALSFVPRVRNMHDNFGTGQYFIFMFSTAMGISLDFSSLGSNLLWMLLLFCFVQFGSVLLHIIAARLLKINGELAVITSTAGIYGPAFIAPVANALKCREVILPGLLCGILGYAVGNYLGCAVGMLFGMIG